MRKNHSPQLPQGETYPKCSEVSVYYLLTDQLSGVKMTTPSLSKTEKATYLEDILRRIPAGVGIGNLLSFSFSIITEFSTVVW